MIPNIGVIIGIVVIAIIILIIVNRPRNRSLKGTAKEDMDLVSLLGGNLEDPEVRDWLASLSSSPKVDENGYCTNYDHGIVIFFEPDGTLTTIFLYHHDEPEGKPTRPFKGKLPKGVHYSMSRPKIRSVLGDPSDTVGFSKVYGMDFMPEDKYCFGDWNLIITYVKDCTSIGMATLQVGESQNKMEKFDRISGRKHKETNATQRKQVKAKKEPSSETSHAPRSLNEFARQACNSKTTIPIQLAEVFSCNADV